MPIPVVCPGCKARFNVSDQFAGKKGPCPKCKVIITIPAAPPPAMQEEVKIHVPEQYASAGKGTKGQAISKPITRQEVKLSTNQIAMLVGAVLMVLLVALMGRFIKNEKTQMILAVVGLTAISGPLALGGYSFLRNDELEPYRGRSVMVRTAICAVVYAGLWGVFYALNQSGFGPAEMWQWLYVAPIFVGIGAATAFAVFDLDFGTASLHYAFFVVCTLLLRWMMNWPPIWSPITNK